MRVKSAYDEIMGRGSGHCAVTAMHEVAPEDRGAEDVLRVARECGWPSPRFGGWTLEGIEEGFKLLGLETERKAHGAAVWWGRTFWLPDRTARPTLAQFVREHPRGVHYVVMRRHALVIRDGQIVDPNLGGRRAARRRVFVSWEVKNAGPGKYQPASIK